MLTLIPSHTTFTHQICIQEASPVCGSHGWPEAGVGGTEGWPYASVLDEDHQDAEGGRFLANGEAGVDSFKQRVICLLEGAVISSFVGGGVKDEADVLADVVSTSCFVLT